MEFDGVIVASTVLVTVGAFLILFADRRDNSGKLFPHALIRSFYRLSRWSWAVAVALDTFLVTYRETKKSAEIPSLRSIDDAAPEI